MFFQSTGDSLLKRIRDEIRYDIKISTQISHHIIPLGLASKLQEDVIASKRSRLDEIKEQVVNGKMNITN